MIGTSSKKFENGKFVKVEVFMEDDYLKDVMISGDFFLVPEHVLEEMENNLKNLKISSKEEIENLLNEIMERNNAELMGCSIKDLANLISEAIRNVRGGRE